MRSLGSFLVLIGIASIALHFLDYNLRVLRWVDEWGPEAGWGIRGGLVVLGLLLIAIGKGDKPKK